MGHFELNSACRNKIVRQKPRKKFQTTELRVVRKKSFNRHEIRVALVEKQKLRKDHLFYLNQARNLSLNYLLPVTGFLTAIALMLMLAHKTLAIF